MSETNIISAVFICLACFAIPAGIYLGRIIRKSGERRMNRMLQDAAKPLLERYPTKQLSENDPFATRIINSLSKLKYEGVYQKGKREGAFKRYYENGQLKSEVNYKGGKPEGMAKLYHQNGKLKCEAVYKNGKKDGLVKWYYGNGQLNSEMVYREGKKDGPYKRWDADGLLRGEGFFKDGKHDGVCKGYHENGMLQSEKIYRDGKENGWRKWYYKDEKLNFEEFYQDGKQNGPSRSYYKNGQLCSEGIYKEGILNGPSKSYYEGGQLEYEGSYENGRPDGVWKGYYENGQLKYEAVLKDGRLVEGTRMDYDEETRVPLPVGKRNSPWTPIYLGVDKHGKRIELDFDEGNIHFVLLAGQTGAGKSVFHSNLYKKLTENHSPEQLGFLFLDMTAIDFNDWLSEYLIRPVIHSPKEAIRALHELADLKLDKKIFVHIEECDMVYEDRKGMEDALDKLRSLKNIYVVYSTSRIDREYLGDWMKRLIDLKVIFAVPNDDDSIFLLGNTLASHFNNVGEKVVASNGWQILCKPFA